MAWKSAVIRSDVAWKCHFMRFFNINMSSRATISPPCWGLYFRLMWKWNNLGHQRIWCSRLRFISLYLPDAHTAFGRDNIQYIDIWYYLHNRAPGLPPEHSGCFYGVYWQNTAKHCDTSTVNSSDGTVAANWSGPHPHPPPGPAPTLHLDPPLKNGAFEESSLWDCCCGDGGTSKLLLLTSTLLLSKLNPALIMEVLLVVFSLI